MNDQEFVVGVWVANSFAVHSPQDPTKRPTFSNRLNDGVAPTASMFSHWVPHAIFVWHRKSFQQMTRYKSQDDLAPLKTRVDTHDLAAPGRIRMDHECPFSFSQCFAVLGRAVSILTQPQRGGNMKSPFPSRLFDGIWSHWSS